MMKNLKNYGVKYLLDYKIMIKIFTYILNEILNLKGIKGVNEQSN